jgi:hypothetical protein
MSSVNLVNRMDGFWSFFGETEHLPLDERLQLFKAKIIEPNRTYYSNVLGIHDDGLIHYIRSSEPTIDYLLSRQDQVIGRFYDNLMMFQNRFPEFVADFALYALPSLGLFKGLAAPYQGQVLLLLGVDSLVQLTDDQFRGYLTHELFHAYHFQRSPSVREAAELALRTMKMPPLWGLLWAEGLACYAVRMVYPKTREEDVLDWRPLIDLTKPLLPDLAKEAMISLTSDAPQDIAGFFYFPRENRPDMPTGCGYYIGMLIAERLAHKWPVETLLTYNDAVLVDEIRSVLIELQG